MTGAGEGIGLGIARALAQAGATVALNDIRAEVAEQAAATINTDLGAERVYAYPGDVADPQAVYGLVERFTREHGPPQVVIANAGVTRYMPFLETTPDVLDHLLGVNQRGAYFLAQAGAKQMIAHGLRGRLLFLSSVVGLQAHANFSVYSMTKAALAMLAKSLALELGPHGITANAISPGATLTPRVQRDDPNYAENWATVNLTGRVGHVEDVTAAALFLVSPAAAHITGHNLVVDGGWTVYSPLPAASPTQPEDNA